MSAESHSWNNNLAHDVFADAVESQGREHALQQLRDDIRSWVRERNQKPFDWTLRVIDGDVKVGKKHEVSLVEMVGDHPISGPYADHVDQRIKDIVPLEAATIQKARQRAVAGDKIIAFPEHYKTTSGEIVTRFISVWEQDAADKKLYHGKRIDLGENVPIGQARKRITTSLEADPRIALYQDKKQSDAFIVWSRTQNLQFREVEQVVSRVATAREKGQHIKVEQISYRNTSVPIDSGKRMYAQDRPVEILSYDKDRRLPRRSKDTGGLARRVLVDSVRTLREGVLVISDRKRRKELKDRVVGLPVVSNIQKYFVRTREIRVTGEKRKRLSLETNSKKPVVVTEAHAAMRAIEKSFRRHTRKEIKRAKKTERKKHKSARLFEQASVPMVVVERKPIKAEERFEHHKKKLIKPELSKETIKTMEKKHRRRRRRRDLRILVETRTYRKKTEIKRARILFKEKPTLQKERQIMSKPKEKKAVARKKEKNTIKTIETITSPAKELVTPLFQVTLGIAFFFLTKRADLKPQTSWRRGPELPKKHLPQEEPTQWILLSIICYLAMVREGGVRQNHGLMNAHIWGQSQQNFPHYGLIFAVSS
ncbi:hypothetical protein HY410_00255 [Candidatus Gottesmanbacteria bacterium]|nr:hypothetical protein [Candidatus Gottesmanbacteria bacterium]